MKINKFYDRVMAVAVCILTLSAISCQEQPRETPTSGSLTMISSEDVFPVIDLQVQDFTRIYTETHIQHYSSSARDAIVQLLNDSVRLVVCPRDFNEEEKKVIYSNELDVTKTKIAYDAVAVIVNSANGIQKISISELKNILSGATERWTGVKNSGMSSAIITAIGEPNSGVYEYIHERVLHGGAFTPNIIHCNSSIDVIKNVQERANVIGCVAISWLSNIPAEIRVLEIGDPNLQRDSLSTILEYFAPYQAYIYENFYPLSRSIYLFTHNAQKGVALGFSSFSAGGDGQKIITKNGLVPATMPVRLVQLNSQ